MAVREFVTLLREGRLFVLGFVAAGLVIGILVTIIAPPTYTSTASFYVTAGAAPGEQNPASDLYQGAQLAKDRVTSYSQLVVGPQVASEAANALGGATPEQVQSRLRVTAVADSVLLTVSAVDSTPSGANRTLTAVTTSFSRLVERLETPPGQDTPQVAVQLVQPPSVPVSPTSPTPWLSVTIGVLAGLLIGIGVLLARRSMDTSIRSTDDLERAVGAPVLGAVPERVTHQGRVEPRDAVDRSDAEVEAYRRIRTNVEFANRSLTQRVLIVTSASPGEGKTSAAESLAHALARVGARVILVDGNVRRSTATGSSGGRGAMGFAAVIAGDVPLHHALSSPGSGFDVLAAGMPPALPNELLSSRRARDVVAELKRRYDYVLVDTQSLLQVTDAVNLAMNADGVILVTRAGWTKEPDLAAALAYLHAVRVPVVGAILNRVRSSRRPMDEARPQDVAGAPTADVPATDVPVRQQQVSDRTPPLQPAVPLPSRSQMTTGAVGQAFSTSPGSTVSSRPGAVGPATPENGHVELDGATVIMDTVGSDVSEESDASDESRDGDNPIPVTAAETTVVQPPETDDAADEQPNEPEGEKSAQG